MAGTVPIFEKDAQGLLRQVRPDEADAVRAARRVSRVSLAVDVLWTAAEEAARDAEEAAVREAKKKPAPELTAQQKLARIGLTPEELKDLLK